MSSYTKTAEEEIKKFEKHLDSLWLFFGQIHADGKEITNKDLIEFGNRQKDFLRSSFSAIRKMTLEEVSKKVIGKDEEIIEENVKTVDGSYDITTNLSEDRNGLRQSQRTILSTLKEEI